MQALILIGGLGTRLRPLTCHQPKPLLPILNRPLLFHQLDLLKAHGIKELLLCTHYQSAQFKRALGTGSRWGLKIRYVDEKKPLGTGGAVKNAAPHIRGAFLVFNGDIFCHFDLKKLISFHRKNKACATLTLTRVKDPTQFGLIETDSAGKILRFLEKPSWDEVTTNTINAGAYVFEPEILPMIPNGIAYSLERGLFPHLLETKSRFYGFVNSGYWMDVGTTEKYLQIHLDLLQLKNAQRHVFTGPKVRIEDFVQTEGHVCIGPGCLIGKGSTLKDCVILEGTKVGEGSRLERCVIGRHCLLEPHVQVGPGRVIGDHAKVTRFSRL